MSQYGLIYRIQINSMEADVITTVDIIKTSVLIPDDQSPTIIPLLAAAEPIEISVINNDRDKFTPIQAKQAVIRFISNRNQAQTATTFSDAKDNEWLVRIYTNASFRIFNGFLMLTDLTQPFQPDPNVVTLTASDHLALLKDIPWQTDDGNNPQGKMRLAEVIALCLKRTGLIMGIRVVNNLRHGSGDRTITATFDASDKTITVAATYYFYEGGTYTITGTASNNKTIHVDGVSLVGGNTVAHVVESLTDETAAAGFSDDNSNGHFYDKVYIDALTAEDQVGSSINCYELLQRILGEDCYITQWRGEWWIMRVDEFDGNPIYVANFHADGDFINFDPPTAIDMSVGAAEDKVFALADAIQGSDRPHKTVKHTFNYDTPLETPCNTDFERGDLITTVSPDEKHYELDCWQQFKQDFGEAGGLAPADTDIYIRRDFINGSEKERYVVIETSGTPSNLIISRPVPMYRADKFNLTIAHRTSSSSTVSGALTTTIGQVRLYGNDGTFWTLKGGVSTDPTPEWIACTEDFNTFQQIIAYQVASGADQKLSDTMTKTVEAPPIPVSGYIRVLLFQSSEWGDTADTYIEPPRLQYLPFINGTYEKYTAQSNQVDSAVDGYNTKRDKPVYLSDSPRPLLKWSMFIPCKIAQVLHGPTSTIFSGNAFVVPGDQRGLWLVGMFIYVENASNTGYYTVTGATYHVIGDTTDIFLSSEVDTATESTTIFAAAYYLTTQFYTAAPFALGSPPNDDYLHPYGHIQTYSVWNQFNTAYRIFTGSVKGIGQDWPDLLYKFSLTDAHPDTDNRYFMLISFTQDWKTGMWTAVFLEVYKTTTGKVYTDILTFKYLQ